MTEAFDAAALRHWQDADLLAKQGRRANADQLYGFAAECGIKSALQACGSAGQIGRKHRRHIDELWDAARVQPIQKTFSGLASLLQLKNPFHDWSTDARYGTGEVTEEALNRHRVCAQRILSAARLGGARRPGAQ